MTEADFRVLELFSGVGGMHLALDSERFLPSGIKYYISIDLLLPSYSRARNKLQSCGCC
jgi:hypothetical protein